MNYQLILKGAGQNGEDVRVLFDDVDITRDQENGVIYVFDEDQVYEVKKHQMVFMPVREAVAV